VEVQTLKIETPRSLVHTEVVNKIEKSGNE
jgi:hypothetical protein